MVDASEESTLADCAVKTGAAGVACAVEEEVGRVVNTAAAAADPPAVSHSHNPEYWVQF